MNEPKDIFKNVINEGDIVCYAARNGTRQELNYAIVLRIDYDTTRERNLTLRGLDYVFFRSGYYRLKGETQATPTQLWVIKDKTIFPKAMVDMLQSGFDLSVRKEQRRVIEAEARKTAPKMTAGERYRRNVMNIVEDQKLEKILAD